MWTIKPPPPLLRFLAFILLTSHLTLGQPHRPPPRPPRLIPFNNHGGHNFNIQEESSSSEEESDSSSSSSGALQEDHYPQSYPNIGYRSKVPIGASHSPHHQVSNPFTLPPAKHLHFQQQPQHLFPQMTETTPATLEEIEASYGDSLLHLKTQQGKPFNSQPFNSQSFNSQSFNSQNGFSSPGFFDQIMDHHHYVPPQQLVSHQHSFAPLGAPLKAPFRPSAPFTPNFESTSGFKPSFGPPVKGSLGNPTFPLGTTGLRPGHVLEAPQHGPLSATYIPSSRPNLYKDLELTYPPLVVGGGEGPLFPFDSSQLSVESKKSSQSVSIQKPSHNPPPQPPPLSPVKDEYKVIFVKPPTPTQTHSPYRAAPPIVLKKSQGPLSPKPTENVKSRKYYPTQDVSSSQDSPLKPEEQAVLYHLFRKTSSTSTVATPPSTATTTSVYVAEEPQSSSVSLPDYSFGDILKVSASSSPLKPKNKKKKSKDKAAIYSISHPYIIPLKSPKIGNELDVPPTAPKRWNRKNRLIPVDEESGFMLTYAPTYGPVASASTTIPTFVDYTQHGNEVEELLKAYGVQTGLPKESKGGLSDNGPTSIEDPPTFYTSTSTTTTSGTTTTTSTTPSPFKRIRVKPPTEPSTTTSTTTTSTTTEVPDTVRTRGTTGGPTVTRSPEGPPASRGGLRNNQISKKLDEDEEISDEYEEEESRYAPRESGVSKSSSSKSSNSKSSSSSDSSVPESDEEYEGGEDSESSEEYADSEEDEQPVKSKAKKKSSKEVDERPKTLDERKRKNVREEKEERSSEEDEEVKERETKRSKTSTGRVRESATVPTPYESTKTSKRGRKPSESENSKEETTVEPPQETRRHKETLKKERKPSSASPTEATTTSRPTLKSKSKRNKSKNSSEEEEAEEVKASVTTHQPRMGKKHSIGMILENIRNSTRSADATISEKESGDRKTSKSKRQRIKPSVAKRLQKSGRKKIRKVRRKNKRKKSRAS